MAQKSFTLDVVCIFFFFWKIYNLNFESGLLQTRVVLMLVSENDVVSGKNRMKVERGRLCVNGYFYNTAYIKGNKRYLQGFF